MSEQECIFCKIIRNEEAASFVYEDEKVAAFMSNRPVNIGHTLVVPKKHYVDIYEIPEDEAAYLFKVAKRITEGVRDAVNKNIRIVQNNGEDAGQVIFHLHVHVIPMTKPGPFLGARELRSSERLEEDANKIRLQLLYR